MSVGSERKREPRGSEEGLGTLERVDDGQKGGGGGERRSKVDAVDLSRRVSLDVRMACR